MTPANNNAAGQGLTCSASPGAPFSIAVNGKLINTRKVEPRNTPTNINAVFNFRNFWDGRANNTFNGVNPFGRRAILADPTARVFTTDGTTAHPADAAAKQHERSLAGGRSGNQPVRDDLRERGVHRCSGAA